MSQQNEPNASPFDDDGLMSMWESDALRRGHCILMKGVKLIYSGPLEGCTNDLTADDFDCAIMHPDDCAQFRRYSEEQGEPVHQVQ